MERSQCPGFPTGARGFVLALLAAIAVTAAQSPLNDDQMRAFRGAEAAFAAKRYAEAASAYAGLATALPQIAELHAKLGLSHFFDRNCDRSAPAFQRALELRPDLKAARVLLAICLSELGRYREALPGLEEGYANPSGLRGRQALGRAGIGPHLSGLEAARQRGEGHRRVANHLSGRSRDSLSRQPHLPRSGDPGRV